VSIKEPVLGPRMLSMTMLIAIWRGHVGTIVRLGLIALRHSTIGDERGIACGIVIHESEDENVWENQKQRRRTLNSIPNE
jgi:hypothetical protein